MAEQEKGLDFPEFHPRALFMEPQSHCRPSVWINPAFPTELQTWAKGEVTALLVLSFSFSFELQKQRPKSGVGAGFRECNSHSFENSRSAGWELCSAFPFPVGTVGLNFLKVLAVWKEE